MNNDILFLENQIVIMETLLSLNSVNSYKEKKLKEQIVVTRQRIRHLSEPLK